MRSCLPAMLAILAASSSPAAAPVVTHIVADTLPGRSLGTVVTTAGAVTTIDGGAVAGNNLFHSFSAFSLASGDTAQWVYTGAAIAPAAVANVISRVTGGDPSLINGTLDSTALPNADFYFINPAGIVFGAGSRINVPAAAYVSTASELRFGAGQVAFSAANPGSTLSTADPVSFGFFGSEGDLVMDGADSTVFAGTGKLSLSAANLTLSNTVAGSPIQAGDIDLFAVGAAAQDVPVTGAVALGALYAGALTVTDAQVERTPSTLAGAGLTVRAGTVTITNGALMSLIGYQSQQSVRGDITIGAQSLTLAGSEISSDTATNVGGGYIEIATDTLKLAGGSTIAAQSCGEACVGNGPGGAIELSGRQGGQTLALDIDATSLITTNTYGPGNAGAITILASAVNNAGTISSNSNEMDAGAAGVISISAATLANSGAIESEAEGSGLAAGGVVGAISIDGGAGATATTGALTNTGLISTDTSYTGNAGQITIAMHAVEDTGVISSSSEAGAAGRSGDIEIITSNLKVLAGGAILTDSSNIEAAGAINILVEDATPSLTSPAILVDGKGAKGNFSQIASANTYAGSCGAATYCGDAGTIGVNANFTVDPPQPLPFAAAGITLSNGGRLTTNSTSGSAGDIALNLTPGSLITLEGQTDIGLITTTSLSNTPGMIYILGSSGVILNGADIQSLGPYAAANTVITIQSDARVLSSDRPNTIRTSGVLKLDTPAVDISGATAVLDLSFLDTDRVLQGQCGALAASGETSQLIDQIAGVYGEPLTLPAPAGGAPPGSAPPPMAARSGCGDAPAGR